MKKWKEMTREERDEINLLTDECWKEAGFPCKNRESYTLPPKIIPYSQDQSNLVGQDGIITPANTRRYSLSGPVNKDTCGACIFPGAVSMPTLYAFAKQKSDDNFKPLSEMDVDSAKADYISELRRLESDRLAQVEKLKKELPKEHQRFVSLAKEAQEKQSRYDARCRASPRYAREQTTHNDDAPFIKVVESDSAEDFEKQVNVLLQMSGYSLVRESVKTDGGKYKAVVYRRDMRRSRYRDNPYGDDRGEHPGQGNGF